MKIILEDKNLEETEVVIRGDIAGDEVAGILKLLKGKAVEDKMFLYKDEENFIVNISDIVYFEACNNKVFACTQGDIYETKLKIYELESMLYPAGFSQISKGVIVNINYVKSVQAEFSGNYVAKLKNSKKQLTISRKYFKSFKNQVKKEN